LVEDVGYMFAKSAEAKGLEIACSVPHDAPVAVKGDPVRVRQIMTNLVNNAVKFTQEGEVVIRVKLLDENSEQARFRFEVQDTGIGISEQVQSRIFSAFAQADSSTTRRYGGTGLGLAIARRLVEMMHGRIGVTSEPDRGSVFWFEIPFIKQNPEARTMIDMAERLTGLRVLVVDDNATNREILAHQLTGWSMRYAGVDGGAAALRELERAAAGKAPFELVILDLHMPEMDGFELARSIRSNACFDGMPLVMLSSVSVSSDHPDRQAAPIDYYLTKPVRQSDLYDAISTAMSVTRVIERGSPSPALGQPPAALCGRVLVAEDNRVNQQVASAMLESLGLSCSIAGNGAVALERLRAERFELVLMDCQMPEMDGFAATAQIRSLQREGLLRPDLPVVALTANAVEGDRERCLAAGMDDYLSKPFTREQLGATLARWLPRSEPVAASASSPSSAAVSVSVDRAESPADEPIHRRALDAIRSLPGVDSEALVANVIGAYLADAPDQLARLCAASAGGDAQALHKTAHAMKSSSANLGAEHLAALCKDLEMLGQAGKLDAAAALLTDVEAELTRVLGALQTQVATQSEGVAPQPSSGPTALIVDDDQVMRMLQQQTLQQAQFDVREAADGEQALQMLAGPPPDLVLLDVDMPGVNGFEVCRRIRQRWDATEVPVIMVTGMDDLQSINQAYESGASDFISKPINWPILGYRARYVLRSAQAARNLRELEERQAAIVRAMPDMIFVLGRDGTYLDYKAGYGASRLVGPERFLGRNVVDVLPGDVSRQVLDGIARALEQGDVQSMVYKLAMPDGVHHYEGRIVRNGSDKVVAVVRDITLQTLYEERIQRLAYFDTLTGMPNRQQFVERLDNELERARRENRRLALLFLDLDGFKRVNDTLGHSAGDTLLQSVAERLKEKLRASDIVSRPGLEERGLHFARLGGDEFTVVLPDIQDIQVATQIAQRLQSVLDQPFRIDGEDITVTASIGISLFPEHGDDAATLLKHADTAMYHAKEQGRNNWKLYATALTTQAMSRLSLENDIRRALERGEFRLVYQPQVLAQDGTIVGMEALIRWQHPERGMVSPGEFIPVAEESGLIVPMGEWVIRSACEQVRSWQRGGVATPRVAVNVSARQVHAADFIDRVIAIITETGISADLLELELTESVLMNFDAQRLEGLHRLRALGAHFSIDDFGTGYSSLAYVKRFPIGMLKIDQSFVRGLPDSLDNAGITTAIIAMARSLGLDVIAEGVETREQRAFLSKAQCPKLQGYLFSPPVAPSEMERLLCQGFIVTPREALAA
jgi:diguanylate cyclase (GGDEF)-like protein